MSDDEAPDTRGPAVIITGSVPVGFKLLGPFESVAAALAWLNEDRLAKLGNIVVQLIESPD